MDLPFGSESANQFVTAIGLVSTTGPHGQNIMACEWTHHISYSPGLIALSVNPRHATFEQIKQSGEFGVGICADDQTVLASVAGGSSGRQVNKITLLEELGFKFYPAHTISVMMVEGTAANMECKLIKEVDFGDHTMFVGEVLHLTPDVVKRPLVYHHGKYWKLETHAERPTQELRDRIKQMKETHRKY